MKLATREEKAYMRKVAHGHYAHCLRILKERADLLFIEKAQRAFEDGYKAELTAADHIPKRSRDALWNRRHDVKKKLDRAVAEWR